MVGDRRPIWLAIRCLMSWCLMKTLFASIRVIYLSCAMASFRWIWISLARLPTFLTRPLARRRRLDSYRSTFFPTETRTATGIHSCLPTLRISPPMCSSMSCARRMRRTFTATICIGLAPFTLRSSLTRLFFGACI